MNKIVLRKENFSLKSFLFCQSKKKELFFFFIKYKKFEIKIQYKAIIMATSYLIYSQFLLPYFNN